MAPRRGRHHPHKRQPRRGEVVEAKVQIDGAPRGRHAQDVDVFVKLGEVEEVAGCRVVGRVRGEDEQEEEEGGEGVDAAVDLGEGWGSGWGGAAVPDEESGCCPEGDEGEGLEGHGGGREDGSHCWFVSSSQRDGRLGSSIVAKCLTDGKLRPKLCLGLRPRSIADISSTR